MKLLSPLRNKNFRHLFIGRSISLLGTGVGRIALAFFTYHLAPQHASLAIGFALVINMLTYIILSPVYGHYAARIPRKMFLVTLDIVRTVLLLIVPWLTHLWQVYIFVLLISACSAGFTPIYQAIIPEILSSENEYSQGLILNRVTYNIEMLLSPSLAALLLIAFDFHALFIVNAVTYLFSAIIILSVTFPAIAKKSHAAKMHVLSGIQQYLSNGLLLSCLALVMISTLAGATVIVNTVPFLHGLFGQSKSITAMAMLFFGMGSVMFSLLMPKLTEHYKTTTIMWFGASLLLLINLLAIGLTQWWWLYAIWFSLGIGTIAIEGLLSVVVNRFANSQTRTALFAANFSLTHGCWLLAYLLVAVVGHFTKLSIYFSVMAVLTVLLLLLAGIINKRNNTKIPGE